MRAKFFHLIIGSILSIVAGINSYGQTNGLLTFSFTTTAHNGRYGSEHVVAVWIQDASNAFVKTNLRMANTNHTINNHLTVWKSKSNLNVVDAITGATYSSYSSPISITWNGTDVSGKVVNDGTYSVWIEESWDEGSSGTSSTSFSFTKSSNQISLTPANTANFTNITLNWTPSAATSILEKDKIKQNDILVYPNPTSDAVNVEFKTLYNVKDISISNCNGQQIHLEKIDKALLGTKSYSLKKYSAGIYFINVSLENSKETLHYKVIVK